MTRRTIAAAVTGLALATAGCSAPAAEPDVNAVHSSGLATPAPASSAPAEAEPKRSPRNNIIKQIGEAGGLCADKSCTDMALTFTVDKIEAGVKCTEPYAPKPANGNFIAVSMTVKTTDKFTGDVAALTSVSAYSFSVVGPDGVTEGSVGGNAYGCLKDSDQLPSGQFAPSSQYVGKVLLDSKHKTGTLVLRITPDMNGGWEWSF